MSIPEKIKELVQTFCSQGWDSLDFLTEDDLRCGLVNFLKEGLKDRLVSIHLEVRFFGDNRPEHEPRMNNRVDIVIIDSDKIKEYENSLNIRDDHNEKGYCFHNYRCAIELKLRRKGSKKTDDSLKQEIERDIQKLKDIKEKNDTENPLFLIVVFDKKADISNIIEEKKRQNSDISFFYKPFSSL